MDPERVVAAGYDEIAVAYQSKFADSERRQEWLRKALRLLEPTTPATVLDLGCGSGIPVCSAIAAAGHRIIGLDASKRQIALAAANVPRGRFEVRSMAEARFEDETFDAVLAFYSITHVPRERHARLFASIRQWLKPGGFFLASLGSTDTGNWTGEWLNTTMYFSHFDAATNIRLLEAAGLTIETAQVQRQDDEPADFLWVIGRRR
ncbi:MAG TPA: methyltransferase domain-containing protein [Allosphingosinicella sp.]|jgi:cyclopropane fatty-acyl-phospholipid synthase-like methyltransferase